MALDTPWGPTAASCSRPAVRPAASWPPSTGPAPRSGRSRPGRPACASPSAPSSSRKFPMVLTWGPEYTQFYNDAYAPFIGAKHPAIGEDIRITLAEGWDALGPPIEHAMTTLEASWLPGLLLLLERAGYREETYFTVSHAPAFGDDGQVAGMHAVCTEVTGADPRRAPAAPPARAVHGRRPARGRARDRGRDVPRARGRRAGRARSPPCTSPSPARPGSAASRQCGCDAALLPRTVGRRGRSWPGRRRARRRRRAVRRPGDRRRRPAAHRRAGRRAAGPAAGRQEPQPGAGRRVPVLPRAAGRAVRRRRGQHPRLRGRAAARGVARRARPRQDDVLLRRQPRAAHPADAAARPDRRRPRRHRRPAARPTSASSCSWRCATGSACSGWSTTCSTSPASRPAGPARCAWRPTSPPSPPSWPGSSGPPPSGPGCG